MGKLKKVFKAGDGLLRVFFFCHSRQPRRPRIGRRGAQKIMVSVQYNSCSALSSAVGERRDSEGFSRSGSMLVYLYKTGIQLRVQEI